MITKYTLLAATFFTITFLAGCFPVVDEPGYAYADPTYGSDVFLSADVFRGSDGVWREHQHQHEVREMTKAERSHWHETHHAAPARAPAEHEEHR